MQKKEKEKQKRNFVLPHSSSTFLSSA